MKPKVGPDTSLSAPSSPQSPLTTPPHQGRPLPSQTQVPITRVIYRFPSSDTVVTFQTRSSRVGVPGPLSWGRAQEGVCVLGGKYGDNSRTGNSHLSHKSPNGWNFPEGKLGMEVGQAKGGRIDPATRLEGVPEHSGEQLRKATAIPHSFSSLPDVPGPAFPSPEGLEGQPRAAPGSGEGRKRRSHSEEHPSLFRTVGFICYFSSPEGRGWLLAESRHLETLGGEGVLKPGYESPTHVGLSVSVRCWFSF